MFPSKKILFIMTGSVACYKACHVVSRLVQAGYQVKAVLTASAQKFVGDATLEGLTGNTVAHDLYESSQMMSHIHLIREADLVLVAPATAHFINKAAAGLGDDLASTLFLAHKWDKPFVIAPAMNTSMYNHPTTQKSLETLKNMGVVILDSASGVLACGEEGYGKLLEPEEILKNVLNLLHIAPNSMESLKKNDQETVKSSLSSFQILITAGGTSEFIDSARRLTNTSTGRTGILLAEHLWQCGFSVHLLLSSSSDIPKELSLPLKNIDRFDDFQSLNYLLQNHLSEKPTDAIIHAAAVSDYSIESLEIDGKSFPADKNLKLDSKAESINIKLKKNFKILEKIKIYSCKKNPMVIGFKLTTGKSSVELDQIAQPMLKYCDLLVQNDTEDVSALKENRPYLLFTKDSVFKKISGTDNLNLEISKILWSVYDSSLRCG